MTICLILSGVFLAIHGAVAVTHSLYYLHTATPGIKNFPDFVSVGMVDGQPFIYYDSDTRKKIPKQDWMAQNKDPEYWESETQNAIDQEQISKRNVDTAKQRFNQTGGVHIFQQMYGCEWDDETGEITGFNQFGYDGEDLLTFNLETATWIAPKQQGFLTKQKWDGNWILDHHLINYHTKTCPEWLKKYVKFGKSSLLRTELPSISVLQKPSSSVRCHATGFYPNKAEMFWRKDGVELHEGVVKGEILPNNDGTFQMSAELKLSSKTPEDRTKYECVFQLSGVKEDMITKLKDDGFPTVAVIGGVLAFGLLVLASVLGFLYWRRGSKKQGFQKTNTSDTSSNPSIDPDTNKGSDETKTMINIST